MKYFFIFLSYILFALQGISETYFSSSQITSFQCLDKSCPETEEYDILFIHSILTAPKLESIRSQAGIGNYSANYNKIKIWGPDSLRIYWRNKGVENVSDPRKCRKITDALNSINHIKNYLKKFRRTYYKAKDKYIILYYIKNPKRPLHSFTTPLQIMDQEFNIVGEFTY